MSTSGRPQRLKGYPLGSWNIDYNRAVQHLFRGERARGLIETSARHLFGVIKGRGRGRKIRGVELTTLGTAEATKTARHLIPVQPSHEMLPKPPLIVTPNVRNKDIQFARESISGIEVARLPANSLSKSRVGLRAPFGQLRNDCGYPLPRIAKL